MSSFEPLTIDHRRSVIDWLSKQVIADARGDRHSTLEYKPADRFWLGRLAPEDVSWKAALGERGQRLDPCSCGFRFRPITWSWVATVSFHIWSKSSDGGEKWVKSPKIEVSIPVEVSPNAGLYSQGEAEILAAAVAEGFDEHRIRVDIRVEETDGNTDERDVTVVVVNASPEVIRGQDSNIYEVRLSMDVGTTHPILLDALPDTFRYDRRVQAFGIYGGVRVEDTVISTSDTSVTDRSRPKYWDSSVSPEIDLLFKDLAGPDALTIVERLVEAHRLWGAKYWTMDRLEERAHAEHWTEEIREKAVEEADHFETEASLLSAGLERLRDPRTLQAFQLMNGSFDHSSQGTYDGWRPFQLGFLLTLLPSLLDPNHERREIVDTLWFATGGGKTETYLAAVVLLCLWDRMDGKGEGITAWSRFPLRMLSLQQTQRFADALAGAELQRRQAELGGDSFALGFLVGGPPNGTPNRIRDEPRNSEVDAGEPGMADRNQILLNCPFCFSDQIGMKFNRAYWRLEHRCTNDGCPWPDQALPFYCVDEEIFRFLPAVVVGTLDKAASVSIQAALRGVYGAPLAKCSRDGHGFTYTPRKATPIGCLVPDCDGERRRLPQARSKYSPGLRIQDELHLLRDSLGAIDAHYETLLDHLQDESGGNAPKVLASSATLAGFAEQCRELYDRQGHVFPLPGPEPGASFWTSAGDDLARRFVGLAPRGQTLEFANDRVTESLQSAIRRIEDDAELACAQIGVPVACAARIVDEYGTNVIYGTKVRDVEAAARSLETQPGVHPLNATQLTGRTSLEEVRSTLERLEVPESEFLERIHVVCASSMLSHGVDIDRFNTITLLGLPLATAEFIQTTSRIGRKHPGLVFVLHRMAVERDSSIFRAFTTFVDQGDRFIDPVAITRSSKRVLEHTFPGMFMARVLGIHEPKYYERSKKTLVMAKDFRAFNQAEANFESQEFQKICEALGLDPEGDNPLVERVKEQMRITMRNANDVASDWRFTNEFTANPPMMSLRQVETQVEIRSKGAG